MASKQLLISLLLSFSQKKVEVIRFLIINCIITHLDEEVIMYGNELVLDLEKKLNLYSHKIEKQPIENNSYKFKDLTEIVLKFYNKKNITKNIESFNKKYNDTLQVESDKLKYNPNLFSKIGTSLFEKLYFEKNSNILPIWLDIIEICFHKYSIGSGLWYWLEEISVIKEVKECFLNEITDYIIKYKISGEQWYIKLQTAYKNKPKYIRYFDMEQVPKKFNNFFEIYTFFIQQKENEFLFEYMAKDIRTSLIYCLIQQEVPRAYYYNENTYQRINKILSECKEDYLIIGEILTQENIRFNTYLLCHPKHYIYGFLNISRMNYFPHNLHSDNEDYAKSWIDMISTQILDIFFNNFKNKPITNIDRSNFFNILNTITSWYYRYSYNYVISILLEKFLNKITTIKIKNTHNKEEELFNIIIKAFIKEQIQTINKKNRFDITSYFLFHWYLKKINYFEKVYDLNYSEEKLKISKTIYENVKNIFANSINKKSFYVNNNQIEKINFSLFYNYSANIIKNKWLNLLDLNKLKDEIKEDDNFYVSSLIKFYINLLINIYEKNPNIQIEKTIVKIITEFGFEEKIGILFSENEDKIFDSFLNILNNFSNEGYQYFLDSFFKFNNLKNYLQLYSSLQSNTKKEKIKEKIYSLNIDNFSSYLDIEESINFTLNEGLDDISDNLIKIYEKMVSNKDQFFQKEKINKFKMVKYKKDLIDICFSKIDKNEKLEKVNQLKMPKTENLNIIKNDIDLSDYKTFITALIYIKEEPLIAFDILKKLCDKSLNNLYLIHMVRAYYKAYKDDVNKKEKFEYILKLYNKYNSKISYKKNLYDYQVLLSIYNSIKDIKNFLNLWDNIPKSYRFDLYIVEIRYKFLQSNNQHSRALEYLNEVKNYHGSFNAKDKKIIEELEKNITIEIKQNLSELTIIEKPKTLDKVDARNYWLQIKDMTDEEHSYIFKRNELNEYIKNIFIITSKELLDKSNYLITKDKLVDEDIITDWFCSLIREQQRFLGWHFGNDRGSYSATKKKAGERDLVIRNSMDDIICIIEAFKQEGFNTTTINSHLNKLDNYNYSGVKLLINLVYYKKNNFSDFCKKYENHIKYIHYEGFIPPIVLPQLIEKLNSKSSRITIYKEIRQKNQEDITIYHYLLDFN